MRVYQYTVYWHGSPCVFEWQWKRTFFTQKKEAKRFAKSKKNKRFKPYPYIIRTITDSSTFRKDVTLEPAKESAKSRKFIKY